MTTALLPPRPDLAEAPAPLTTAPARKHRTWIWITVGVVLVLILGATGTVMGNLGREAVDSGVITTTGPQSVQDIYDELQPGESTAPVEPMTDPVFVAAEDTLPYAKEASQELQAGFQAIQLYDVDGAAKHLDRAADAYMQIGVIWNDVDDAISMSAIQIANEWYQAGNDMRAGRYNAATQHMKAGLGMQKELLRQTRAYT